jgi:hypothetical protein
MSAILVKVNNDAVGSGKLRHCCSGDRIRNLTFSNGS